MSLAGLLESKMPLVEATQFRDADKYSSYLKTPAGRLRSELAWKNLQGFLPAANPSRWRVLDVGGGTGSLSVRLATMGFQVVLLDNSEGMLGFARKEAEANGVAARISFRLADASQLHELFEAESFDFVVCHNLLEYVVDPGMIVGKIGRVLRKDAVASLLLRNRGGEVLKAAIKSGDWGLAKANLSAETVVDSLFGKRVRIFNSKEILDMLARAGLDVAAQYGVRVFSDYAEPKDPADEAADQQLLELESILGARPEFAAMARYTQLMACRSNASGGSRSER